MKTLLNTLLNDYVTGKISLNQVILKIKENNGIFINYKRGIKRSFTAKFGMIEITSTL